MPTLDMTPRASAIRTDPETYWRGAAAGYHAEADTLPPGPDYQRDAWREGYAFGRETRDCYRPNRAWPHNRRYANSV